MTPWITNSLSPPIYILLGCVALCHDPEPQSDGIELGNSLRKTPIDAPGRTPAAVEPAREPVTRESPTESAQTPPREITKEPSYSRAHKSCYWNRTAPLYLPEKCMMDMKAGFRDELPYSITIKAIMDELQNRLPLDTPEKKRELMRVYRRMAYLLQSCGNVPAITGEPRYTGVYRELSSLSFCLDVLNLDEESARFHDKFFSSDEFQNSTSKYRSIVFDVRARLIQAQKEIHYPFLVWLNHPGLDHPDLNSLLRLGELFEFAEDYESAIEAYRKLPTTFLGPVRVAEAYFKCGRYEIARELGLQILLDLPNWFRGHEYWRMTALWKPIQGTSLEELHARIEELLAKIEMRLRESPDDHRGDE